MQKLILASSSPRRKEILSMLGIDFKILPADIDESVHIGETTIDYVERLAVEKAYKVAKDNPDALAIGSDLSLDLDGIAIGKAKDRETAFQYLRSFSGRRHYGRVSYAILQGDLIFSRGVQTSVVDFKPLSDEQINTYLDGGEWQGLGGAYGVQGSAASFIANFKGSYFDILGLPIYQIASALEWYGFALAPDWHAKLKKFDTENLKRLKAE